MKKMNYLFLVVCLLSATTGLRGQNYSNAIGLRAGVPASITFKQFLGESNAVEVTAGTYGRGFRYRWTNVTAALQFHKALDNIGDWNTSGLNWYWGAGGSVFFYSYDDGFYNDYNTTYFGVQGYLGLDYTFAKIPVNLTLDWVPTFYLNGLNNGFGGGFGSLGIRYVLSR